MTGRKILIFVLWFFAVSNVIAQFSIYDSSIDPKYNSSINPQYNSSINPQYNSSINPRFSSRLRGGYVFDLNDNAVRMLVQANMSTYLAFDSAGQFTSYWIRDRGNGFVIFNLAGEWISYASSNGAGGVNVFSLSGDWVLYAPNISVGYS